MMAAAVNHFVNLNRKYFLYDSGLLTNRKKYFHIQCVPSKSYYFFLKEWKNLGHLSLAKCAQVEPHILQNLVSLRSKIFWLPLCS